MTRYRSVRSAGMRTTTSELSPAGARAPDPRAASVCLRIAFTLMCAGAGWRALTEADAVFSFLFIGLDWGETVALRVAHGAGFALLAAGALVLWPRLWPVPAALGLWIALEAAMAWSQHPPWEELLLGERAVRWLGPLALALLVFPRGGPAAAAARARLAERALVLAAAATFVCHGWRALRHDPTFLDLLFLAASRFLGAALPQPTAEALLGAIGAVDLLVAALLVLGPRRLRLGAAGYMAVWGATTALSRTVQAGFVAVPETLLRAPNAGVPLALLLWWLPGVRNAGAGPTMPR